MSLRKRFWIFFTFKKENKKLKRDILLNDIPINCFKSLKKSLKDLRTGKVYLPGQNERWDKIMRKKERENEK